MKKQVPFEFIFHVFSLFIAIILVHAFYVSVVRPNAAAVLEEQAIQINANPLTSNDSVETLSMRN